MVAKFGGKAAGWLNRTREDVARGFNSSRMTPENIAGARQSRQANPDMVRNRAESRRTEGQDMFTTDAGRSMNFDNASSRGVGARGDTKMSGAEQRYGAAGVQEHAYARDVSPSYFDSDSAGEAFGKAIRHADGNLQTSAIQGGHGSVLGMGMHHATRGAIGGGLVSGTTEAAQGGSFWEGAKDGMLTGAVGYGGYRMGGAALGATSANPFSDRGIIKAGSNMMKSYSPGATRRARESGGQAVSSMVESTMTQQQMTGLAQSFMNKR